MPICRESDGVRREGGGRWVKAKTAELTAGAETGVEAQSRGQIKVNLWERKAIWGGVAAGWPVGG